MSLVLIGSIAAGVATMANTNEDSPVLWGIITFVFGVVGAFIFGSLGAFIGSLLGAGLYVAKTLKFG
ncbi:MAG: hypothetical protein ACTHK7_12960 [Aureliella sp.]